LAGNIPDSKTVKQLLSDLNVLNLPKVKLVMDQGFYSTQNMNDLYVENLWEDQNLKTRKSIRL
jgi:transposase